MYWLEIFEKIELYLKSITLTWFTSITMAGFVISFAFVEDGLQ